MGRRARRPAHTGVLRIDKPSGVTSHDVVQSVRRSIGQREVGHTCTLDPMSTGLLVLTLGRATRIGRFLEATQKAYEGEVVLGAATDTFDAEGQVTEQASVPSLTRSEVEAAVQSLVGPLRQRVPVFSAVKVNGERLHAKARRGEAVEAPERTVHIHEMRVLDWSSPRIRIEVVCSKGTYIRTLATQIGQGLGLPAHLGQLRRTRVGPHGIEDAVALEYCDPQHLISMDRALAHLPQLQLDDALFGHVQHGRPLTFTQIGSQLDGLSVAVEDPIALICPQGSLAAVAFVDNRENGDSGGRALRYACVLSA
ncbi:MAG: tRNA pseudouridine(55) synthase TruB [Myxococcota bacterium]